MPDIDPHIVTRQLLAVLREAFERPPVKGSYFTDNDPEAGLFGTLRKLTAVEASQPTGGSTIAAHVFHVIFALEASAAWVRGDRSSRKWSESWRARGVEEAEWARMRASLESGYAELRDAVTAHAHDDEDAMGGAIGAIAHAACHLGAIRQKILLQRSA